MNKILISFVQAEQKVNTLNDKFKWKKNKDSKINSHVSNINEC